METKPRGYIALISVLIVSAVVLALSTTVSLLGIGEAQSSLAQSKGESALQLVEGCAEDALLKAQQSSSYNGGNITRPEGTCVVSVAKNGNNWTLTVTSTQTDYNRTVIVRLTRASGTPIAINTWQDSLPVPTPTPTNTPTPTPTLTPTPTPPQCTQGAQDSFQRAGQTHWGTASDGQTWGGEANTSSLFSINNNTGKVTNDLNPHVGLLGPTLTDTQVLVTLHMGQTYSNANFGSLLRYQDNNNYYKALVGDTSNNVCGSSGPTGMNFLLKLQLNGNCTVLAYQPFTPVVGTEYNLRFQIVGNTLNAKIWQVGTTEPGWMLTANDSTFNSGRVGVRTYMSQTTAIAHFTSFTAWSKTASSPAICQ